MTDHHDRRLIEDSLPLDAISYQSTQEKLARDGHISTLHTWWARRPLNLMRAAIFASLIPAPNSDEARQELHRLIGGTRVSESDRWRGGIVDWDSVRYGNDDHIRQAQELIKKYYRDAPPKVLDPFMGGGSTGLEALRLGCEAHGVELNPVAYLIELCTLVYPQQYGQPITRSEYESRPSTLFAADTGGEDSQSWLQQDGEEMMNPLAEDVRRWSTWVMQQAYEEIGHLYKDPEDQDTLAYIWARKVKCPNVNCGADIPILNQWWLSKQRGSQAALRPVIDVDLKRVTFKVAHNDEINFDASGGTRQRGRTHCLVCGETVSNDYLRERGRAGELGSLLVAVVYRDAATSSRECRVAEERDLEGFELAESVLPARLRDDPGVLPNTSIFDADEVVAVADSGVEHWGSLYNARQAVALITLVDKVRDAYHEIAQVASRGYAKVVSTYLALIVDRMVSLNSTACRWNSTAGRVDHAWTRPALPMTWDYAEINPFTSQVGGWSRSVEQVIDVVRHCTAAADTAASLRQGNATLLPYSDESLDTIITDPPYFGAVPYADLSDHYYVWLKRSIGGLYRDLFHEPHPPREEIDRPPDYAEHRVESEQYFERLRLALAECYRVLRPSGVLTLVYPNRSSSSVHGLVESLIQVGLLPTAVWGISTESRAQLVTAREDEVAFSTLLVVCRKQKAPATQEGQFLRVRAEIRARVREKLQLFREIGLPQEHWYTSALGSAFEILGRYSVVRRSDGQAANAEEIFDIVSNEVNDFVIIQDWINNEYTR